MQYLIDNKEWIFSGIGATIFALIVTFLFSKRSISSNNSKLINGNDISLDKSHSNNVQLINSQIIYGQNDSKTLSQESITAMRELYRLVDLTIKSVEIGLAPIKFNPPKSNLEYLNDSIKIFDQFSDYFDANEILFDSNTNIITKKIKDLTFACLIQQRRIEDYKLMKMDGEIFSSEVDKIHKMYDSHVAIDLPHLKEELKNNIQNQMKK